MIRGPIDKTIFRDSPDDWKNYTDPLPACEIAPEPYDEPQPSVSTIKQAWPKFLNDWIAGEVAKAAFKHRDALPNMDEGEALALLKGAADRHRDAAADRGHAVHAELENLLDGAPSGFSLDLNDDAKQYHDALALLVKNEKMTILASEVVVIGEGFGGTFDAAVELSDGRRAGVDYKSRKKGKAATRYAEEGLQLGAYFRRGEYWIVQDGETLRRMKPLDVEVGIIISIAPDGYRIYEVDLDEAARAWDVLHGFYLMMDGAAARIFSSPRGANVTPEMMTEGQPPLIEVEAVEPADAELAERTRNRVLAVIEHGAAAENRLARLWPDGVPTFRQARESSTPHTPTELEAIVAVLDTVEGEFEIPFDPPPRTPDESQPAKPAAWQPPDEGGQCDAAVADDLRKRRAALDKAGQTTVAQWVSEATDAGRPFNLRGLGGKSTVRRATIVSAAISLAAWGAKDDDARVLLHLVLGEEPQPAVSVGCCLGSLTADEAEHLHAAARTLIENPRALTFDTNGAPTLAA